MSKGGPLTATRRMLRRIVRVLARPVKRDRGTGGVVIQPYRGYGSLDEIYLMGRVFRQSGMGAQLPSGSPRRDFLDLLRRLMRRGLGDAVLEARFGGATERVTADRDGYFHVHMRPKQRPAKDQRWHTVELELKHPAEAIQGEGAQVVGQVYIPPASARCVVISDIDDTVMFTGVVNKVKMVWRLFMQGPHSRLAFPGVASFYRALHKGPTGNESNPMLYVSRGPWSIYEILQAFFRLHRIPVGPILFLREWGLSLTRPLPRRAEDHKLTLIRQMLELYSELPFVLFGDSGQHDPEIYAQVVHEHPGRVKAVYIRNVSRSADRVQAIEQLAQQVLQAGSPLMLAADTFAMAQHAAEHGLIPPEALKQVLTEQDEQEEQVAPQPTHEVKHATAEDTQQAVQRGDVQQVLEEHPQQEPPPNVAIESEQQPEQQVDRSGK